MPKPQPRDRPPLRIMHDHLSSSAVSRSVAELQSTTVQFHDGPTKRAVGCRSCLRYDLRHTRDPRFAKMKTAHARCLGSSLHSQVLSLPALSPQECSD